MNITKYFSIFTAATIFLWLAFVLLVYLLVTNGYGQFLEFVLKLSFAAPLFASIFLAKVYHSEYRAEASWNNTVKLSVISVPILLGLSGFVAPLMGRAMLGFASFPGAKFFSFMVQGSLITILTGLFGILFIFRNQVKVRVKKSS